MRILFIEDDEALASVVSDALRKQHYVVDFTADGEAGWDYASTFTYDLILLDVTLPKLDGISLCKRLRQEGYNTPVLLLTARDASADKVEGLDAGADDYVVKPCSIEELLARIRALLRRQTAPGAPILVWGDLSLNPSSCEVAYKEELVRLTPKEYSLLELFLRHPRHVFSRGAILEHLWSFDTPPGEETVRAHIKGLRRKLKTCGAGEAIETVYGIGYRLKSLPHSPSVSDRAEETQAAVAEAWKRFKPTVLERMTTLDEAVSTLKTGTLTEELRRNAEKQAHKLTGSLGMFGLLEGSRLAREIERWLIEIEKKAFEGKRALPPLESRVSQLHRVLEELPQSEAISVAETEEEARPPTPLPKTELQPAEIVPIAERKKIQVPNTDDSTPRSLPLLLVVDGDEAMAQELCTTGVNWDIQVEVAANPNEARAAIERETPDVVLLELNFPDPSDDGLVLLEELNAQLPQLPVLVLTGRDNFDDRLAVARLGGRAFFSKPLPSDRVLAAVRETLDRQRKFNPRILAVDDDPLVLKVLGRFLKPRGIELYTLDNPRRFWETLEATVPDLLVLDLQMPHINGLQLCQVVRNDSTWSAMPILFLSADQDSATIHSLYQVGADDWVSKPVTESELITRIFNRLERLQLLRAIAETDPLTGLANRSQSTKELYRYLRLASINHQNLCLAIVDVDRFKRVNDIMGHETGDRVLKRIGSILRQQFRSDDLVARWGGEEFVIGMYGMNLNDGMRRMSQVLHAVRSEVFVVKGHPPLHITLSGGIAEYPHHGKDLSSLYRAADRSLGQAKVAGCDRILPATVEFEP